MKLFLSLFTLIFLFSHQVAFAEIPTEVNLSANQQEKIYKQVNNLYDDLEIKLSKFDEKTQLKKFKTVQSKISKILNKELSDKMYFSLFYLNTLLDEKIDILEYNQKIISQVDPNIDLTEKNGNKTFVGFVATWCPHCTSEVPVLDAFYKENKGKVNMQLIVTDGKYFDGDFSIPQDLKNSLTYEQVTGQTCGYVPSYVIYDENKKIVEKQCGAKLTKEKLTQKLLSKTAGSESGTGVELPTNIGNNLQTETLKDSDIVAFMYTNKGLIKIKLFYEQAPKTVINFIALSQKGYYNDLTFHRVIKDFMIQGGDPEGTGLGGESIYGEEFEDEFSPELKNIRGSLSMANSGKNTNGSQFFINQKDNNFLDNKHSVFGQVVEGLENVDKIAGVKVGKNDKPEKDVKIIKIEIKTFQNGSFKNKKIDIDTELKKIKDDADKKAKLKEEMNKNRVVKTGDKIKVHYIATLAKNNEKFDSSYDRNEPMEFEVGAKMMIEGFDRGVQGMKVGEKKTIKISPQDGYGERDPKNTQEVPKAQLEEFEKAGIKLEVGEVLPTAYGPLTIVKVTKDMVTVDMNHFLAGEYLLFEVEILEFVD